jgi:hypothetical protein
MIRMLDFCMPDSRIFHFSLSFRWSLQRSLRQAFSRPGYLDTSSINTPTVTGADDHRRVDAPGRLPRTQWSLAHWRPFPSGDFVLSGAALLNVCHVSMLNYVGFTISAHFSAGWEHQWQCINASNTTSTGSNVPVISIIRTATTSRFEQCSYYDI